MKRKFYVDVGPVTDTSVVLYWEAYTIKVFTLPNGKLDKDVSEDKGSRYYSGGPNKYLLSYCYGRAAAILKDRRLRRERRKDQGVSWTGDLFTA